MQRPGELRSSRPTGSLSQLVGAIVVSLSSIAIPVAAVPPATRPATTPAGAQRDWFLAAVDESHQINRDRREREGREALEQKQDKIRLAKLSGAAGTVVTFSGDGSRLLTAGGKSARVWDVKTFKPLISPIDHEDSVQAAHLSPDGHLVLTASGKSVRLWNATTGKLVRSIDHEGRVTDADFSPDGKQIAAGWGVRDGNWVRGAVELWDAATGKKIRRLDTAVYVVQSVGFSPDGTMLYAVREERYSDVALDLPHTGRLLLWDAKTGKTIIPADDESRLWPRCLGRPAFSADGKWIAFCFNGGSPVIVVDARNAQELAFVGESHAEAFVEFQFVQFGKDEGAKRRLLIAGSCTGRNDASAQVWDIERTTKQVQLSSLDAEPSPIFDSKQVRGLARDEYIEAAVLSADGRLVALAGTRLHRLTAPPQVHGNENNFAGVWDVATGKRLIDTIDGVSPAVVSISPDGSLVAFGYGQGLVGQGGHTSLWRVPGRPSRANED